MLHLLLQRSFSPRGTSRLNLFPCPELAIPGRGRYTRLPIADCRLPTCSFQNSCLSQPQIARPTAHSKIGNWKSAVALPSHHDAAPGKSATEGSHQNNVVFLDAAAFNTFIQTNRD